MPSGAGESWPPPTPFDPFGDGEPDERYVDQRHVDREVDQRHVDREVDQRHGWEVPDWQTGTAFPGAEPAGLDAGIVVDPTPTGEIPIVGATQPAPATDSPSMPRLRRRVRRILVVVAVMVPVVLLIVGLGFIGFGLGGGGSTTTARSPLAPSATTGKTRAIPTPVTVPGGAAPSTVVVTGDPLVSATALLDEFVAALEAGDNAAAAKLTGGVVSKADLLVGFGDVKDLRAKLVGARAIGPNAFRLRLAIFPASPLMGTVKGGCYDWTVDAATRTLTLGGHAPFITARTALRDGAALLEALSSECAAAAIG